MTSHHFPRQAQSCSPSSCYILPHPSSLSQQLAKNTGTIEQENYINSVGRPHCTAIEYQDLHGQKGSAVD